VVDASVLCGELSVLKCLGDMGWLYRVGVGDMRDCACDLDRFEVASNAEAGCVVGAVEDLCGTIAKGRRLSDIAAE